MEIGSKLREAIKAKHDRAKSSFYTQLLISGKISKEMYGEILFNHSFTYSALESVADKLGLLDGIEGIKRADRIMRELKELDLKNEIYVAPATYEYVEYVNTLKDPKDVFAHLYVRHLNLMQGAGQMKKVIPFAGEFYAFEDVDNLKEKFLKKLDDSMIPEASTAFDMIAKMFKQLEEHNA